jgi:hypothetical protein
MLSIIWTWIDRSRRILAVPMSRSNGYDFSNQGLLGIWESFPSTTSALTSPPTMSPALRSQALEVEAPTIPRQRSKRGRRRSGVPPEFDAALLALGAYHGLAIGTEPGWRPGVRTARLIQRRFALELCGWSLKEDDFDAVISQYVLDDLTTRCIAQLYLDGRKMESVREPRVG